MTIINILTYYLIQSSNKLKENSDKVVYTARGGSRYRSQEWFNIRVTEVKGVVR